MTRHPDYYTELLRRRFTGDPPLTPTEHRELELHLLICPQCNHDYAVLLMPVTPARGQAYLEEIEAALDADVVTPYLRDLVRARRSGRQLTDFQQMVWHYVLRDPEAMGRYRLLEADWQLHRRH
jgi:hypothetical protein